MNKLRETARIVAASAALSPFATAALGGQASAHTISFPLIRDVAAKINSLPGIKDGDANKQGGPNVYYQGKLPHNQRVSIGMTSSKEVDGQPDPRSVKAIDIEVYKPLHGKNYIQPLVAVEFIRNGDGTWTASERQAIPGKPDSTFSIQEIGEASAEHYVTTIKNGIASVEEDSRTVIGDECAADFVLDNLELDAYDALTDIENGSHVPLRDFTNYAAIQYVDCGGDIAYTPGI
jgi:hypothetical protein